jgi:hypothetical protein
VAQRTHFIVISHKKQNRRAAFATRRFNGLVQAPGPVAGGPSLHWAADLEHQLVRTTDGGLVELVLRRLHQCGEDSLIHLRDA